MDAKAIIISGAGGIAQALALMLAAWYEPPLRIFIGNRTLSKAEKTAHWVREGTISAIPDIYAFHLPEQAPYPEEAREILAQANVLLDCLPGSEAPRMAELARDFKLHYANLTEHVEETEKIMELARKAQTGFILQSGLAPGFIDVLAHGMFLEFCESYGVEKADNLLLRVGALTEHSAPPAYYAFTWSPVGVATEYVEPAVAIRDFEKCVLPSLSERQILRIRGKAYEEALTSGGAADLPDALAGKVRNLDYKTLRYPGHYEWVEKQLTDLTEKESRISLLQRRMEEVIAQQEEDLVVVYAAVQGKDAVGKLHRREKTYHIQPQVVGKHRLRAIQTTTAAPLAQCAQMLLEDDYRGVMLQSMIKTDDFLEGKFVRNIFGPYHKDPLQPDRFLK